MLRVDNGPEFLGEALSGCARKAGLAIRYIQPGKPKQKAYIERSNRTIREELLDQPLVTNLDDVREAVHWWMIEYNKDGPHAALNDLPLSRFANNPLETPFIKCRFDRDAYPHQALAMLPLWRVL